MKCIIKYLCLIVPIFIVWACSKEEHNKTNDNQEDNKVVKMAAINVCGDTNDADILLLSANGSYILCDAENEKGYSVIYMNDSIDNSFESGLTVFLDEEGSPVMVSSSEGHFIFNNIRENRFDFAYINNQDKASYYYDVPFDYQRWSSRTTRGFFDPWIGAFISPTGGGWDEHNKKAIIPFLCKIASFAITAGNAVWGKDYFSLLQTFASEIYKSNNYHNEWLDTLFDGLGIASLSNSGFKIEGGIVVFTSKKWGISALAEVLNKYGDEELKKLGQYEKQVGPVIDPEGWQISLSTDFLDCYPDEGLHFVDVSSKAAWDIDESQIDHNWCEVKKLDVQVAVQVKPNEGENDRICNLVVYAKYSSEIAPVSLTIKQSGILFELSPDKLTFTQTGGSKGISITTNDNIKSWDVTSYPSWCKIEKGDYSFFVDVERNEKEDRDGVITVTAKTHGGLSVDRKIIVEQKFLQCPDDKHPHAIDLGLPSGIKWACCNIGASKPEEIGNCYAWGETETKVSYNWNNYRYWSDFNGNGLLENNELSNIGDDISGSNYDAATINWGVLWRMPRREEFWEMVNNTSSRMIMNKNQQGYYFKGKNGNEIFLPCSREYYEYWMSNISSPATRAKALGLNPDWIFDSWGNRCSGLLIRPISN